MHVFPGNLVGTGNLGDVRDIGQEDHRAGRRDQPHVTEFAELAAPGVIQHDDEVVLLDAVDHLRNDLAVHGRLKQFDQIPHLEAVTSRFIRIDANTNLGDENLLFNLKVNHAGQAIDRRPDLISEPPKLLEFGPENLEHDLRPDA